MSETTPELPPDLQHYSHLHAILDSANRRRVYGVTYDNKKIQLCADEVYIAYGYGPEDYPNHLSDVDLRPILTEPPKSLKDEFKEAIDRDEALDVTYRQWVLAQSKKDWARWYSATKVHGEFDSDKHQKITDRINELSLLDIY